MWFNVGQYFIIGLVPILGDLLDIALRRNSKNAKLLEKLLMKRLKEARGKNEIAGYVVGDSAADLDSNHPTGRVPMFPTGYADRNGERLTYNTPRPAIVAPAGRGQGYGRDGRREGPSVPLPTNHPSGQGHQKPRQGYGQPF